MTQNKNNAQANAPELMQLLDAIYKKITKTNKKVEKAIDPNQTTFLRGKSAGLTSAYTMIKVFYEITKFNLP